MGKRLAGEYRDFYTHALSPPPPPPPSGYGPTQGHCQGWCIVNFKCDNYTAQQYFVIKQGGSECSLHLTWTFRYNRQQLVRSSLWTLIPRKPVTRCYYIVCSILLSCHAALRTSTGYPLDCIIYIYVYIYIECNT